MTLSSPEPHKTGTHLRNRPGIFKIYDKQSMLNWLQFKKQLSPESCPVSSLVFPFLHWASQHNVTVPSHRNPVEPPPPISCSTKSLLSRTVFTENRYKLVSKIKWDLSLRFVFFFIKKGFSYHLQHSHLVKHHSALLRKGENLWLENENAFDEATLLQPNN